MALCLTLYAVFGPGPKGQDKNNPEEDATVVASGEVRPIRYVRLTSDVGGRIKEIYVNPGDRIEKGQALVLVETQGHKPKDLKQYSPLRGVISDISARVGDIVGPKSASFMMVADTRKINAEIAVDDSEIKLMRRGQPARIMVDAFNEKEIHGVVSGIRPLRARSTKAKEFIVVIEMREIPADLRDRLRPGMVATVWIKRSDLKR